MNLFNIFKPKQAEPDESRELEDFAIYMDLFENEQEQQQTKTLVETGLAELHGEGDRVLDLTESHVDHLRSDCKVQHPPTPRCDVCNLFASKDSEVDGKFYCKKHNVGEDGE